MRSTAVLVAVCCVAALASSATASSRIYVQARVSHCLYKKGVIQNSEPVSDYKSSVRKTLPAGLLGRISIIGYLPSAPNSNISAGPEIDGGTIFFFKTAAAARAGAKRLSEIFEYGTGLPLILKALIVPPPTPAVAKSLLALKGNTVVLWSYPFKYANSSKRLLATCLATSKG